MTKYIFYLLSLLAAILPLAAQNLGSLDTTFANQGVLLTPVSNNLCFANGIQVQPDNKIILCGSVTDAGEKIHGVMLRYMPNGKGLDSTFGVNGRVDSYIDSTLYPNGSSLYTPIILADGRLLAGAGVNFATKRFWSDGRNDSSFQGTGLTYFPPSTAGMGGIQGGDMKLQADGKIVRVGKAMLGFNIQNVITVRFTSDGDPDTTFGANHQGYVMTDLSTWGLDGPQTYRVLLQSDGKMVVVGMAYGITAGGPYEFLLRYNSNGTVDSTFGTNGLVSHQISNSDSWGWGGFALVQSDDKIVVAVEPEQTQSSNADVGITRFLPNGKIDSSYGTNGIIYKHFSFSGSTIEGGLLLPDNSLFVSVTYTDDNTQVVYRVFLHYDIDGNLDPNFQYYSGTCIYNFSTDNYGRILGCASSATHYGMNRFFSGLILGISNESDTDIGLRLFPNPSDKILNLNYSLSISEKVSISLWNSQGQKVHTFIENQSEAAGEHRYQFDVPEYLPNGIYFIQMQTSKGSYTSRWVK